MVHICGLTRQTSESTVQGCARLGAIETLTSVSCGQACRTAKVDSCVDRREHIPQQRNQTVEGVAICGGAVEQGDASQSHRVVCGGSHPLFLPLFSLFFTRVHSISTVQYSISNFSP